MAATVVANPIRRTIEIPEHGLITFNNSSDIPAQTQSAFLSVPGDVILYCIYLACKKTSNTTTLASIICIVNCSSSCRLLRLVCRKARTDIDSTNFVRMIGSDACEGDLNLNEHRTRIHQMSGGNILRGNRADERGVNTGEYESDGTSIIIVRDCNENTVRTSDNPFGRVYVFIAIPEAKPCMKLDGTNSGWNCLTLSLKEGLECMSGHHINESFAHPLTKWVSRHKKKARVWNLIGPKNGDRNYMHREDETDDIADESVVEISVTVNVSGIRNIYFVLAQSGSPTLSGLDFVVPYSGNVNPIAQFFNCEVDLSYAICRYKGNGEEATSILDSKFTVDRIFTDSMEDVNPSNIMHGKRRASVMRADQATRLKISEDAHITPKGFLAPSDSRYNTYAAGASANGWIDGQLEYSSDSEFIALM